MKTSVLPLAAVGMAVLSAVGFCGPLNKRQVPAGAKWVVHIDHEAFSAARLGQLVNEDIALHHQAKIDALTQLLGSDLTRDIYSLTVFGPDGDEANAAALVHGRFDRQKLLSLLALNPAYAESAYGDLTLYHWQEEMRGKQQAGAFAAEDMIVISQTEEAVKGALDVLAGRGASLASDKDAALRSLTEGTQGAFVTAAATGLSELTGDNDHAAVLKNSRIFTVLADEVDGQMRLFVQLEADSVESAVQIEQVARGMVAFASLQMQKMPEAAAMLQAISLTRTESQIVFSFQYPSAELYALIQFFSPPIAPAVP